MNLEDKVIVTGYINDNMPCYYMRNSGKPEAISPQKALDFLPFFSIFNGNKKLSISEINGKTSLIFKEQYE